MCFVGARIYSTSLSGPRDFLVELCVWVTGSVCRIYESIATVGEIRVWWMADFQSGSRVLKKVF